MDKQNLVNELTIKLGGKYNGDLLELQQAIADALANYNCTKLVTTLPSTGDGSTTKFLLKKFVEEKACAGNSKGSIKQSIDAVNNICKFCNKEINLITSDDVKTWLNHKRIVLNNSDATRQNYYRWLNTVFTFLVDNKYVSENPMKSVPVPKANHKEKQPLNNREIAELKLACRKQFCKPEQKARDLAMISFMLDSGVRVSELCSIKFKDVNFNTKSIVVTGKGNKERTVYFYDETLVNIREYIKYRKNINDSDAHLFETVRGSKMLTPDAVRSELNKLGSVSGIDRIHPHLLRATFATRLVENGTPIEVVSKLMGHSNIDTTMIYVKHSNDYVLKTIKAA